MDDRGVLFVISDVMGKGIPAALLAAILRSVVRSLPAELHDDPALLLSSAVNGILYDDFSRVDMFATAARRVSGSPPGRRLLAASAGHCPLLIAQARRGRNVQRIEASGPPLGGNAGSGLLFAEDRFAAPTRAPRILLYTDGVTELADPKGEMFAEERLAAWPLRAPQRRSHAGHSCPGRHL